MDRRKRRTMNMLDEAFTELIFEKSFNDVSVAELCDRAMVTRGTFYRHFSSRDEYLAYYVRTHREKAGERVRAEVDAQNMQDYCRAMVDYLVNLAYRHHDSLARIARSASASNFATVFSLDIADDFASDLEEFGCFPEIEGEEREHFLHSFASFYAYGLLSALYESIHAGLSQEEASAVLDRVVSCMNIPEGDHSLSPAANEGEDLIGA